MVECLPSVDKPQVQSLALQERKQENDPPLLTPSVCCFNVL